MPAHHASPMRVATLPPWGRQSPCGGQAGIWPIPSSVTSLTYLKSGSLLHEPLIRGGKSKSVPISALGAEKAIVTLASFAGLFRHRKRTLAPLVGGNSQSQPPVRCKEPTTYHQYLRDKSASFPRPNCLEIRCKSSPLTRAGTEPPSVGDAP